MRAITHDRCTQFGRTSNTYQIIPSELFVKAGGGLVMIDEPAHYLPPSLVSGFLARLESPVEKHKGQLLISSHLPSVWSRYDTRDKLIELGDSL